MKILNGRCPNCGGDGFSLNYTAFSPLTLLCYVCGKTLRPDEVTGANIMGSAEKIPGNAAAAMRVGGPSLSAQGVTGPFQRAITTREALFKLHLAACTAAFGIMSVKNKDYGEEADALANFRDEGLLGIITRLGDKKSRMRAGAKRVYEVKDETFVDTALDAINYCILALAWYMEEHPDAKLPGMDQPRMAQPQPSPALDVSERNRFAQVFTTALAEPCSNKEMAETLAGIALALSDRLSL